LCIKFRRERFRFIEFFKIAVDSGQLGQLFH
jgi:hypothetical protein